MNKLGFGCMMTVGCEVEVFSKPTEKNPNKRWKLFFVSIHIFPGRNQLSNFVMFFPEELFPPNLFKMCEYPCEQKVMNIMGCLTGGDIMNRMCQDIQLNAKFKQLQ